MGKILKVLASTKLPKNTIFSERFVVECCETFHFHFRNLRFDVTRDNFLQLRQALKEIEKNYLINGEPKSHHHLELGRAVLNPQNCSQELSIELCENVYKKYFTGWDSHFHEEDTFIHLHWRDMRIEMSNSEFIEFGKAVSQACQKMKSYKYKSLSEICDLLEQEKIIYAVIRNWEKLPENVEVGPHSDLDLLIHPDHVEKFDDLLDSQLTTNLPYRVQRSVDVLTAEEEKSYILVDLRQPGDHYFPDDLAWRMLNRRIRHKNFWVLHPEDHLTGLAYHILFHKGYVSPGYYTKLCWLSSHVTKWPFLIYQENDVSPYLTKIVLESKFDYVQPEDLTVRPVIPLLFKTNNLLTNRHMRFGKQTIFSRVYKIESDTGKPIIVKQTNGELAKHEFNLLNSLKSNYFPRVWEFRQYSEYSLFHEDFIQGVTLSEARSLIADWSFDEAREFVSQCIELVQILESNKIQHRDFRADNLIVTSNGPVLFDFGWATAAQFPMDEPEGAGLGRESRPPDGEPYDPYGLGMVIHLYISPPFPEFGNLADVLLAGRSHKPVKWNQVNNILNNIKEKTYPTNEEKFIALCMNGCYQKAQLMLNNVENSTEQMASFWLAYIQTFLNEQDFPAAIIVPIRLQKDERLLSRLIQECLSTGKIERWSPILKILLKLYRKRCKRPDAKLFYVIDKHFNRLVTVVQSKTLRLLYEQANRQIKWMSLYSSYLLEKGTNKEQSDFLSNLEKYKQHLTRHTFSVIAQMYFNSGKYEKASYYANLILQHDPYDAECARILAVCCEEKGRTDEAIHWWKHFITLNGIDKEARKHFSELKYHSKVNNKNEKSSAVIHVKTDNPAEIIQTIRQFYKMNEIDMALCYIEKLKQIWPKNADTEIIINQMETILAERQKNSSTFHVIIPPLTEETYSENPAIVKRQLEKLIKTDLGNHPIIKSRYKTLSELDCEEYSKISNSEDTVQVVDEQTKTSNKKHKPENVVTISPESAIVNSLFQKGNALIQAEEYVEGLGVLTQLLEHEPNHFETLQLLGDLYHQLGKDTEAKHMWELALAQQPTNLDLLTKLGRAPALIPDENIESLVEELSAFAKINYNS